MQKKIDLSHMAVKWPSVLVARAEMGAFSGGAVSSGYTANLDAIGEGPEDGFYIGRKKVYPVPSVIRWLEARCATGTRKRVKRT
jgi:hypothetical protein